MLGCMVEPATTSGLSYVAPVNFEGFEVRTVEDVDRIRREVERRCREIGKPITLTANYDDFYLDPAVSDIYFSMIAYLEKRYYCFASRYTTSAFMRLKLGEALAERHVAPHIFETLAKAQQFARSQQRARPIVARTSAYVGWKRMK
jgi:propionate CoA-transferase